MKSRNPVALLLGWLGLAMAPNHAIHAAADSPPPNVVKQANISGRVSNAATGANLEGASIALEGTVYSVKTQRDGTFRLDVPAGSYTLSVSYTGLDSQRVPLSVQSGTSVVQDIELTGEIYKLSPFTVSGEREGNALAITLQRQSAGVRSVVSTDAFGSLGANPADLLVRLPGVFGERDGNGIRYIQIRGMASALSTVTMDGNRLADAGSADATREVQYNQINADTIERIEVIKAPTPDMDADSIGGAVNFISKSAFDRKGRHISGQFGIIYRLKNGIDKLRPNYSVSYSEVFNGKIGVAFNYGYRQQLAPLIETSRNYENKVGDPAYTYQFGYNDINIMQTRAGGGLRLDYKLSEASRFYIGATRNKFTSTNFNSLTAYQTAQSVATRNASGVLTGTGAIVPEYTSTMTEWRPVANSLVNVTLRSNNRNLTAVHADVGGEHRFGILDIDYSAYTSHSTAAYPHTEDFIITASGIGIRIEDTDEPYYPRITQVAGPDVTNINSYLVNQYSDRPRSGKDIYNGAQLNIKKRFESVAPAWIKAGLRVREQTRDLVANPIRATFVGPDGVMGVNPANGINDDNLAQFMDPHYTERSKRGELSRYPLLPRPGYVGDYYRSHPELFRKDAAYETMQTLIASQNFKETITAAYVAGNVEIGKLSILGGLRVEETRTEGEGAKDEITRAEAALRAAYVGTPNEAELIRRNTAQYGGRQTASGEYREVFPGLHFKYEPINGLVVRASYSTNIGRPAIGQLIPATTVNNTSQTITTNNPGLKPQYGNNFDFGAEYYFEPVGMFSANVFLKEIKQFIYTSSGNIVQVGPDNGFDGEYAGYSFTSQDNGGYAKVRGFELAYQQQLNFLPGWWSGFGVYANYSRNETEGDYGGTVATTQVPRFVPQTANAGISYIRSPFTFRLQYNHADQRLLAVNPSVARLQYDKARDTLDIKTVYQFSRRYLFYFDVTNVFAELEEARVWGSGRPGASGKAGPLFIVGVKANY